MTVNNQLQPWGRWSTLGLGFLALFAGQLVGIGAVAWPSAMDIPGLHELASNAAAVSMMISLAAPIQTILLLLMVRYRTPRLTDYFALKNPRRSDVLIGVVCLFLLIALANATTWLFGRNIVPPFQRDLLRTAGDTTTLVALLLSVVVVAPIGEELLFRGFLFRGLTRSSSNAWLAIVVTAALWAVVHPQYDFYLVAQVFGFGLLLGWLRWVSGSTILTMLLHAIANAEAMIETSIAGQS